MVRALCSHRRGRGFEPLYLYQCFERRLEAIQKNGSLAQVPLPFSCLALCLALRSVPISGNEIVTLGKPRYSVTTLSLRSLRLSAKRQLSRSCYHFIIDVSTAKRSPSTTASSGRSRGSIRKHLAVPYRRSLFRPRFARPYGLKRSKKWEFGTNATPFFLS